jgi:hypothetical protein
MNVKIKFFQHLHSISKWPGMGESLQKPVFLNNLYYHTGTQNKCGCHCLNVIFIQFYSAHSPAFSNHQPTANYSSLHKSCSQNLQYGLPPFFSQTSSQVLHAFSGDESSAVQFFNAPLLKLPEHLTVAQCCAPSLATHSITDPPFSTNSIPA